jgi:hypothetical protein
MNPTTQKKIATNTNAQAIAPNIVIVARTISRLFIGQPMPHLKPSLRATAAS